jgi:hypothetical protein
MAKRLRWLADNNEILQATTYLLLPARKNGNKQEK